MPVHEAGILTDPPISVPWRMATHPVATATAEPPDDPPGVRIGFQGFRVTPYKGLSQKLDDRSGERATLANKRS
jgi:hypothetical protein